MSLHELETYRNMHKAGISNRELEASVLTQAALKLKECQNNWNSENCSLLDDALKFNQLVWSIFQAELVREDNSLPTELRRDILSLSVFIDRRIFEIMAYPDPDKLNAIININLNLAAGLRVTAKKK